VKETESGSYWTWKRPEGSKKKAVGKPRNAGAFNKALVANRKKQNRINSITSAALTALTLD
jgi:hypothetical protein